MTTVRYETHGPIAVVTIDRPEVRNAVDDPTAAALAESFRGFDEDADLSVAILTGAAGYFCAGADLKAAAAGQRTAIAPEGVAPMGPTRMALSKPVVAAIEGYAVAGGLELAVWCDLRVAASDAVLGVFNRRFGVPLLDGGSVRLPRLLGQGRALDLILTGRPIDADEALRMGLIDRVVEPGTALDAALALADLISAHPQTSLRSDRMSALEQWDHPFTDAMGNEFTRGREALVSGETLEGARRFASGVGRHGAPDRGEA